MSHSRLEFYKTASLMALTLMAFGNLHCQSKENTKQGSILGRPKNTVGDFYRTHPRHTWRLTDEYPLRLSIPDAVAPADRAKKGIAFAGQGLWKEAIREHAIALLEDPTNAEFRKNLEAAYIRYGDLLRSKKDFANAVNQYRHSLYIAPSNLDTQKKLTDTLHQLGL